MSKTCKKIMNNRAAHLNDDNEEYFEEMKEEWLEKITKEAENFFDRVVSDVDDRPTVEQFVQELEDSDNEEFDFKDYPDWFDSEVSSACDDYGDAKYEEQRDRDMEDDL